MCLIYKLNFIIRICEEKSIVSIGSGTICSLRHPLGVLERSPHREEALLCVTLTPCGWSLAPVSGLLLPQLLRAKAEFRVMSWTWWIKICTLTGRVISSGFPDSEKSRISSKTLHFFPTSMQKPPYPKTRWPPLPSAWGTVTSRKTGSEQTLHPSLQAGMWAYLCTKNSCPDGALLRTTEGSNQTHQVMLRSGIRVPTPCSRSSQR